MQALGARPSLSFVGRATPGLRYWAMSLGAVFAMMALQGAIAALAPPVVERVAGPILGLAFVPVFVLVVVRGAMGRAVRLDVEHGRVVVDGGRGGAFPLAGAALGSWRMPVLGTEGGTVLQLVDGARTLRILGYYHRAPPGLRVELPPDHAYDVRVTADELSALLGHATFGPPRADAAPSAVLSCELFVHPWSVARGFTMLAPWGIALLIVFALAGVLELTPLSSTRWGQYVEAAITLPIVIGGLVVTFVRAYRRRPELALDVSPAGLAVRDLSTGRVRFQAPASAVRVTRWMHRVVARGSTCEYPCLQIAVPGQGDLTVGVYDPRNGWRDATGWLSSTPGYVVSQRDWEALVVMFGFGATARGPAQGR